MTNSRNFNQLFINEAVVAIDKPGGYLSVPSRLGDKDSRPCLGRALEKTLGCRLWPIHRLDEEVSGVILYARNADAHRELTMAFEHRKITKIYEAFTDFTVPSATAFPMDEVVWECLMLRGKKRAYESPHGKASVTRAKVLEKVTLTDGPALKWRLEPLTGRGHQLRFELFRHGYPIVGDYLYGSQRFFGNQTIALRCVALHFKDMSTKLRDLGIPEIIAAQGL